MSATARCMRDDLFNFFPVERQESAVQDDTIGERSCETIGDTRANVTSGDKWEDR